MFKFFNKVVAILFLVLIFSNSAFTQRNANWQVIPYASNINKIVYHPFEYDKDFLITNAVIAKPISTIIPSYKINANASLHLNKENFSIQFSTSEDTYRGFKFELQNDEMIFGGGERALPMNRRGYRFELYNRANYAYGVGAENLNYSVPFFISNKGYGLFFDNGSKGFVDIAKSDRNFFEIGFVSGELNVYVITGNSYQEILSSYHKLTGTQPLPPRWALGNLMSRFGYTSQQEATTIAKKMKDDKIPVDAIIFDLFWFGDSIKGSLGNLDWVNTQKWPNPVKMIADFKAQHINTTLITEPYILQYTNAFIPSLDYLAKDISGDPYMLTQFYFGKGGLIDVFQKKASEWIWNYHYKKQIKNGVTAWWTDLGEPESHPTDLYHNLKDYGIEQKLRANEVHNIYGHYWNKMLFENYAKEYPKQRLFHLNRSGFAGSQRYSIFPWSGDVGRNWSGLQAQLPVMLGMSLSGVPYIHADAGGFALGEYDDELYARWMQFAAFTPILRPHGTALFDHDKQAVSIPSEAALFDEPYKTIARNAILERYKLLPYNYTLAYRQTKYAEPIVKPLFYNYDKDTNAMKFENEYLFGDNILVAPVIERLQETKKVYLPNGNWFLAEINTLFNGNNFINVDVREYKTAVLYKEGSFIPQYNCDGENTVEIDRSKLNVTYVPSAFTSSYEMYDDDGENKNAIAEKQFELINFSSSGLDKKRLVITIKNNNGLYKGKPQSRNITLSIPTISATPKTILINNIPININNNGNKSSKWFGGNVNTLIIPVTLKNIPIKVECKW